MRELHGNGTRYAVYCDARALEVAPNLWAGVGLVRGGAGTALVGSHDEVAELIGEYAAIGVQHFILSGYPHLEETYRFGEGVRPALARTGLLPPLPTPTATVSTAFLPAAPTNHEAAHARNGNRS